MKKLYLTLIAALTFYLSFSQKGDTLRRYFDEKMVLTTKNKSQYTGVTIRQADHWYLFAVYPDTGMLIKCFFKDEDLRIKDGPFTLYHRKNIKAVEGRFTNNVRGGVWKSWYEGGQLKDSGLLVNNTMAGTWISWYLNGNISTIVEYVQADSILVSTSSQKPTAKGASILDYNHPAGSRHGISKSFYESGKLMDSGLYEYSSKRGIWKQFYESGELESVGSFYLDQPQGEWQYFRKDGSLSTKEDYSKGKINSLECFDENGNFTGSFCSVMKPAVAKGSFYNLKQYAMDNIYWPKELNNTEVEGVVKVQYTISAEGKMTEFKVLQTPHQALAKEVERFFNSLEGWYPAISHNRAIEYTTEFEIEFYR